jgi:hypothetical protein
MTSSQSEALAKWNSAIVNLCRENDEVHSYTLPSLTIGPDFGPHSPASAVRIGSLLFDLAIAWSSYHDLKRSSTLVHREMNLSGGETPPGS